MTTTGTFCDTPYFDFSAFFDAGDLPFLAFNVCAAGNALPIRHSAFPHAILEASDTSRRSAHCRQGHQQKRHLSDRDNEFDCKCSISQKNIDLQRRRVRE